MNRDEESTGRVRIKLLAAFERSARTYQEVGESMARWLAGVQGRPVVLVVEDDEQLLKSYRDALGSECILLESRDSVEATSHLERTVRLDLAILDLVLPIGSGFEVATTLRARWPNVPILVVSAYLDGPIRSQLGRLGGPFEFYAKPDSASEVGAAARRHLT